MDETKVTSTEGSICQAGKWKKHNLGICKHGVRMELLDYMMVNLHWKLETHSLVCLRVTSEIELR